MNLKDINKVLNNLEEGNFTLSRVELAHKLKEQIEQTDLLERKIHELENPRPMLCPECQEVTCDDDCSNPRDKNFNQ